MMESERLHALDAVRAFALLSGIVLHAAMSFLPGFAITGIPIIDNSPSVTLSVIFFVIHLFRMSLFFLIAGFFSHLLLQRRGLRAFIGDRLRRIAVPLVVGWLPVISLIVIACILAVAQKPGGLSSPPVAQVPTEKVLLPFPLTHLWFLYVLLWLYVLILSARSIFTLFFDRNGNGRRGFDWAVKSLISSWWGPFVLAAPLCVALMCVSKWSKWFGIPTPDQSLIPNLPAMIGFSTAFGLGWLMHRQPQLLSVWERGWRTNLAMASILTVAALEIAGPVPAFVYDKKDGLTAAYAVTYTLGMWYWNFALIGIGLRFFAEASPRLRYLADSSYWLYLIHLPVVFMAQAAVMQWNVHWSIKFPLILAVTIPLMLLSYHYLVRSTFIGGLLNGRRYPRAS